MRRFSFLQRLSARSRPRVSKPPLTQFKTNRFIAEALAASTVKLEGRDILATWKVLFSIVATPLLYTIYAIIASVIAYKKNAPPVVLHWMPVWIFVGMPFLAMSSLKFGEAGMDVFK